MRPSRSVPPSPCPQCTASASLLGRHAPAHLMMELGVIKFARSSLPLPLPFIRLSTPSPSPSLSSSSPLPRRDVVLDSALYLSHSNSKFPTDRATTTVAGCS